MRNNRLLFVHAAACAVALCLAAASRAAEKTLDPDEQLLKEAKIGTDNSKLLAYLRKFSERDDDLLHIDKVIRQLGGETFQEREEASRKLLALGLVGLPRLLEAAKDKDREVARRAKALVDKLRQDDRWGLPLAAVRVVMRGKPDGTFEALLRYLPFAGDEETEEEIWYSLDELAVKDKKHRALLVKALADPLSPRRALSGCLLGRLGTREQRTDVRKLLKDPEPLVRLRVAQGLLAGNDKVAIPVLIALLDEAPSVVQAWQAEELLHWVAGDDAPKPTVGARKTDDRKKCRTAWQAWWRQNEARLDFVKVRQDPRRPGLMLVATWENFYKPTRRLRSWLYGCDGKPRWRLAEPGVVAQLLPGDRVLVRGGETFPLTEMNLDGTLVNGPTLSKTDLGSVLECKRLPNGNTFIFLFAPNAGAEISPTGEEVYRLGGIDEEHELEFAWKLGNGLLLALGKAGDSYNLAYKDPVSRKLVRGGPLDLKASRLKGLPKFLARGHVLIIDGDTLTEYDFRGTAVWKWKLFGADSAARLRNGNTLISSRWPGLPGYVGEVDVAGRTVWELPLSERCREVRSCLGLIRLGFGRVGPEAIDLDSVPERIKALRNKDVRIRECALHSLYRHGHKSEPAIPALIECLADSQLNHYTTDVLNQLGAAALPALHKALKTDKRASVRAAAARLLGTSQPPESVEYIPDLIKALKDKNSLVRQCAAGSLGSLARCDKDQGPQSRAAVVALIGSLKDGDEQVRLGTIHALGRIGPAAAPAVPALIDALNDKNSLIRIWASEALGNIGPAAKAAVPTLINLLDFRDKKDPMGAAFLRRHVVWALGQVAIDNADAKKALERVRANDPDNDVKEAARKALKSLSDT
jgi:HEAT repeat protein